MKADAEAREAVVMQLDSSDCASFFNDLGASRLEVVPVIGAGLGIEAGAPSGAALAQHLIDVGNLTSSLDAGLFDIARDAAESHGEAWLQQTVATFVESRNVRASPVLQALAKVETGLVLTTNYDLAIEHSARLVGREVVSLTLDDLPTALRSEREFLRVVHLHGVVTNPSTIVLSPESYSAALEDERMQLLTRALGSEFRLLFLGHSLSPTEQHLRRDLRWAARIRSVSGIDRQHLLLAHVSENGDAAIPGQAQLLRDAGVQAVFIQDLDLRFRSVDIVANILAGPSRAIRRFTAATIRDARDPNYLPLPVAEVPVGVDSFDGVNEGRYLWKVHSSGHTPANALDARVPRLLLMAGGGYGKTQELHQIGFRCSRPALYKRLRSFGVVRSDGDLAANFVREMDDAESYHRVEKLDIAALETSSYVFLLDGLDEVPATGRSALIAFLETVSRAYPQHRFVVATRLMASTPSRLDGFATYVLKPDNQWLEQYGESRSVRRHELQAFLGRAPGISELASIPIYASAIVDRVHSPQSGNLTPLSMILSTATRDGDPRVGVRPEALELWLNRIALYMETRNEVSIPLGDLVDSLLHRGIDGIHPSLDFLNELAERALLLVQPASVSFVANIVQEARAASAILSMEDGGLAFLSKYVVLPHEGTTERRSVRESWRHSLWLLYPSAGSPARRLIEGADPLLAARAAVITADSEERYRAMWTIWKAYSERQVWLDRNQGARYQDDESALEKMAQSGLPEEFKAELMRSLTSASRIQRGNALVVLSAASVPELPEILLRLVADPDAVVRRRAGMSALVAKLHGLSPRLAEQAYLDPDETARETLIGCAIDLAETDEQAIALATRAPDALRPRALGDLFPRIGRGRSLELVEDDILRMRPLLDSTVAGERFGAANSWTDEELATLARIFVELPDATSNDIEMTAVLRQRPMVVIREWLKVPLSARIDFEFFWLVNGLSTDELKQLMLELADDYTEGAVNAASRSHVLDHATEVLQRRTSVDGELAAPEPAKDESPTLRELVRAGDKAQVLRDSPSDDADWASSELSVIKGWVEDELLRAIGTPRYAPAPSHDRFDSAWSRLSRWAAYLDVKLPPDQWPAATRFELERGESAGISWIRRQSSQESWKALGQVVEQWPRLTAANLARIADENSRPLTASIFNAISACDAPFEWKEDLLQKLAGNCDKEALRNMLREADGQWIFPALVKLGDCEAEAKLLTLNTATTESLLAVVGHRSYRPWVQDLSCPSSAPVLFEVIRRSLVEGAEIHELETAMRALDRCAGAEVESYYDLLISDEKIPGAAFLFYQKRVALDTLIEKMAQELTVDGQELSASVAALVH
ncbi:SIR2 family protein [Arthrobacter sp. CC3]|uniref:SIR2 family protein n=1 Tax=Arthrobacter sp. CC3 TaxID=3029185 RepID=UPI003263C88C